MKPMSIRRVDEPRVIAPLPSYLLPPVASTVQFAPSLRRAGEIAAEMSSVCAQRDLTTSDAVSVEDRVVPHRSRSHRSSRRISAVQMHWDQAS